MEQRDYVGKRILIDGTKAPGYVPNNQIVIRTIYPSKILAAFNDCILGFWATHPYGRIKINHQDIINLQNKNMYSCITNIESYLGAPIMNISSRYFDDGSVKFY